MRYRLLFCLLLPSCAALAAVACSSTPSDRQQPYADRASPDSITWPDDPSRLIPGASTLLADNLSLNDVGQSFGVDDDHIPYPDTYWPFSQDGIDVVWNSDPRSALEKYMTVFDPASTLAAKAWERGFHGVGVPNAVGWWGHCPGWTGAAMANAPVKWPVYVASDGFGSVVPCSQGDPRCVRFEIGDINALMAEVYLDGSSTLIGARCDKKPSDIRRDSNGRIIRDGSGCKGLNAGALLVVLGQQLKKNRAALAIDAQNEFNTDQIWNQPAYRYTVNRYQAVNAATAANLVAYGTTTGSFTTYPWNPQAQGFIVVDIAIKWVSEYGPNVDMIPGTRSTRETRFVAVIELSEPSNSASSRIIGGEYIDDSNARADRLTVPPFVWVVHGPGPERVSPMTGGSGHNPYVSPSIVRQLVQLGGGGAIARTAASPWNTRIMPSIDPAAGIGVSPFTPIPYPAPPRSDDPYGP